MLAHALKYASNGWKVVALRPKNKTPLSDRTSYKHATNDPAIIEAWWGAQPNANIGIQPAASGLVVLDVDSKNGGLESLDELINEFGAFTTLTVKTPTGGFHYYFKLPEGEGGLSNHIGFRPGLDLIADKNHVVAPPSIHPKGGQYEWEDESIAPAELPDWLAAMFSEKSAQPHQLPTIPIPGGARGKLSAATLKFLSHGAPEGTWNNALFKAAKDFQEQGYTQEEFVEAAMKITGHLDPNDMNSIQSAFNSAPKYGPRLDMNESLRALILRCHYITDIADPNNIRVVDLAKGETHNIHIDVIRGLLDKNEWAAYRKKNCILAQFTYNPRLDSPLTIDPSLGVYVYNTFVPPKWRAGAYFHGEALVPVTSIPPIYEEFFRHLTDNDNASYEYLLDWLATSLQGRNFTILTAIGNQGIGKGTLGEIMKRIHGESNFSEASDKVFKEKFNGKLEAKTLVYVDEIDLKTKESHDRIKAVVNEYIEIEKKGIDAITVKNYASFYISSNDFDAIRPESDDRRYSVIQLTNTKLATTPLMGKLTELLDGANIEALGKFLYFRPIARDMLFPFRSRRFEEVKNASLADWELYILEEFIQEFKGGTPTIKAAQEALIGADVVSKAPGRRKFENLAKKYPKMFSVKKPSGGKPRVLEIPANPEGYSPD